MLSSKNKVQKEDMTPFIDGQVLLLKDGQFGLVMSVDPVTKLMRDDKDRIVNLRVGAAYKKGSLFKGDADRFLIIEDARNGVNIAFDIGNNKNLSIAELIPKVATHVGILNPDRIEIARKISSEIFN